MGCSVKQSRYNHFVVTQTGELLAYNALSGGLARIGEEHQAKLVKLSSLAEPFSIEAEDCQELSRSLLTGGFVVPEDSDEIANVRAAHYAARFGFDTVSVAVIPELADGCGSDRPLEGHREALSRHSAVTLMPETIQKYLVSWVRSAADRHSALAVTWIGADSSRSAGIVTSLTEQFKSICGKKASRYSAGLTVDGCRLTENNLSLLAAGDITHCDITVNGTGEPDRSGADHSAPGEDYSAIAGRIAEAVGNAPISFSVSVNVDRADQGAIALLLSEFKRCELNRKSNMCLHFGRASNPCDPGSCMLPFSSAAEEFAECQLRAYRAAMDAGFRIAVYPKAILGGCMAVSSRSVIVEPSGDVHNCRRTVGLTEMRTGELTENGIAFNSSRLKWLGWSPFGADCDKCDVLPLCMGGCPYESIYSNRAAGRDDRFCSYWRCSLPRLLDLCCEADRHGLSSAEIEESPFSPAAGIMKHELLRSPFPE